MSKFQTWSYIISAVAVALLANSISAIWAKQGDKFTIWLLLVLLISPFVYVTFGLAVAKLGLTVGSATIDSLLTVSTIFVGLIVFKEWGVLSPYQLIGVAISIVGIILMHFHK
jgi:multidrug transporter EmrE-like cation transporter